MIGAGDMKLEESECGAGVPVGEEAQAVTPTMMRSVKPELTMFRFKLPSFGPNSDRSALIIQRFNQNKMRFPRCLSKGTEQI